MKKMLKKKVKGFTLIEMLVVLGIISILLLLFVPNLSKQKEAIQKKGDAAIVKVVESQMDIYELDHGVRPTAEELYNQEMITEDQLEKYNNVPICIAKTQYSFSDDPKNLECIHPFNIHIKDVVLKAGAEFIVIITGKIMTMPGLPRIPAAENIDIDKNGNIIGIF